MEKNEEGEMLANLWNFRMSLANNQLDGGICGWREGQWLEVQENSISDEF